MSTKKPQSLTSICVLTKYRKHGATIEDIIDSDLDYVTWCIENNHLLLDDEAYTYYKEKLDNYYGG